MRVLAGVAILAARDAPPDRVDNFLSLRVRCLVLFIALTEACSGNTPTSSAPSPAPTPSPVPAMSAKLTGTVADVDTGAPIAAATVVFLDSPGGPVNVGLTTMTDGSGTYRFDNLTLGHTILSSIAPGYEEWRAALYINPGESILNWQLRRIQPPITFTGQVPDPPNPSPCANPPGSVYPGFPCKRYPFTLRRIGSIDVTLTWAAGPATLDLAILDVASGIRPWEVQGTSGTLHLHENLVGIYGGPGWAGAVEVSTVWPVPIPFTVTFSIAD